MKTYRVYGVWTVSKMIGEFEAVLVLALLKRTRPW